MHTREEKMEAFGQLLDIMDALRERCPWNAEQTMKSIRPMTEEEVYELSDAVVRSDDAEICKEIGDILYHMVFYARIAQEEGKFDIADSLNKICDKMKFRHPHVFNPDGSLRDASDAPSAKEIADTWELVKAKEKDGNKRVLDGIPDAMPAVLKALSMQEKARGCGFDWDMRELFGDLLFATINASRKYGIDPEEALSESCSKFRRRFSYLEEKTLKQGIKLTDLTPAQMDQICDEGKAKGL